jgi:hypothetical protein
MAFADLYPANAEESSLPTQPSPIGRSACRYSAVVVGGDSPRTGDPSIQLTR